MSCRNNSSKIMCQSKSQQIRIIIRFVDWFYDVRLLGYDVSPTYFRVVC